MIEALTKKRILIFVLLAYLFAWATALVIFLTGGLENSPPISIAGVNVNLAYILLATAYMFSPAAANLITRAITREGWKNLYLQPHFDRGRWVYYLIAWFLPGLLTIIGMVVFFIIFPGLFDPELTMLKDQLVTAGEASAINPWLVVIVQTLQALLIAPLLNALPTFGEEFGWRAYLQPKLMPFGTRKAVIITGLIWGVWHWPVIMMGYNYGFDYAGAPYLGPLAMVWFTLGLAAIFGWVTYKAQSVWPAVIAHGALNGIAALSLIFVRGDPNLILGPSPVGIIGGLGFTIVAVILLLNRKSFKPNHQTKADDF